MAFDFPSSPTIGQEFVSGAAIYAWNGNGWAAKMKSVSADTAAGTSFAPAGNIAATDVQAAIQEVDAEKVAKAGDTMTGTLQVNMASNGTGPAIQTSHRTRTGTDVVWSMQASVASGDLSLQADGTLKANAKSHRFGPTTPGGTIATGAPTQADASILLYDVGGANWCGMGADANGYMWWRVGTTGTPVNAMYLDTTGRLNLTWAATGNTHAVRKIEMDAGDAAATAVANAAQTAANNANANANNRVARAGDWMTGQLTIQASLPFQLVSPGGYYKRFRTNEGGTLAVINHANTAEIMTLSDTGVLSLNAHVAATQYNFAAGGNISSGTYMQFLTPQGGSTALYLGGPGDPSNYYRNTSHRFESIAAANWVTMNAGGMVCSVPITATGQLTNNGTIVSTGAYMRIQWPGDAAGFSIYNTGYGAHGWFNMGNTIYFSSAGAGGECGYSWWFKISSADCQLFGAGGAWKPGGGSWADSSDARIKTVLGNYDNGLASINALRPVRYVYKGNDIPEGTPEYPKDRPELRENDVAPFRRSPHHTVAEEAKEFIGLIAQEAEPHFPEIIGKRAGTIDGVAVDDIRSIDPGPLIFALINAVKELSAEVETLKQQIAAR
jgi:hypothetical protein